MIRCVIAPVGLCFSLISPSTIFLWNSWPQLVRVHTLLSEGYFTGVDFIDSIMIDSVTDTQRRRNERLKCREKALMYVLALRSGKRWGRGCITQLIGCSAGTRRARTLSMFGTRKPSEGLSEVIWRLTGDFENMFLSRKEISCRRALVEQVPLYKRWLLNSFCERESNV